MKKIFNCLDCGNKILRGSIYCKKDGYKHRKRPSGLIYVLKKENPTSFKKGFTPWNKGIGWPDEIKEKIRLTSKGQHRSFTTEFKKGIIVWNNGKKIWHGTVSEYRKLHRWVRKIKGKPNQCIKCGSDNKIIWGNISQSYLKDINDWMEICRSCHTKNDFAYMKTL